MSEVVSSKRNRICLDDYNYRKDIENRLFMSQLTALELHVLEEILYSPLKVPVSSLSRSLEVEVAKLVPILEMFGESGLLELHEDTILVDKEMRKYYEAQIVKFEEDFAPGMEFLQSLLRKVPIQVLPIWYAIPRTSNNIFNSLVEKYLATPQVYQRHLQEIRTTDPLLGAMMDAVFAAEDYKIFGKDLMERLQLSREEFEENMLYLEFNFACCLGYEKIDEKWEEVVTPFQEWRDYLRFLRDTELSALSENCSVAPDHSSELAFIEGMKALLAKALRSPLTCSDVQALQSIVGKGLDSSEIPLLLTKLTLLKLAELREGTLTALDGAQEWLNMPLEESALFVYRHPFNRLSIEDVPKELCTEKNLREVEKCLQRIRHMGWIYFDDFFKGARAAFNTESRIALKRNGRNWKYALPEYSDEEKAFIHAAIFRLLREAGLIATGACQGKECFRITRLGCTLFGPR